MSLLKLFNYHQFLPYKGHVISVVIIVQFFFGCLFAFLPIKKDIEKKREREIHYEKFVNIVAKN